MLSHVNPKGHKSPPHDHGASWAVYGQATHYTDMTEWRRTDGDDATRARHASRSARQYRLEPGHAGTYDIRAIHNIEFPDGARFVRVTGTDLERVPRLKFDLAKGSRRGDRERLDRRRLRVPARSRASGLVARDLDRAVLAAERTIASKAATPCRISSGGDRVGRPPSIAAANASSSASSALKPRFSIISGAGCGMAAGRHRRRASALKRKSSSGVSSSAQPLLPNTASR